MKNIPSIIAITLSLGLVGSGSAHARTSDLETVTTSTATYGVTSREGRQIIDWLMAHDAPSKQGLFESSDLKGEFLVSIKTVRGSASDRADVGGGPPVPLPPSGTNGETVTIAHTGGGITETWTYTWVSNGQGGGWVLTYYEFQRSTPPTSEP